MKRHLIMLVCIFMAQSVFGAVTEHQAYEEQTRKLFTTLVHKWLRHVDTTLGEDILDNESGDEAVATYKSYREAVFAIRRHHDEHPPEYDVHTFWTVGAEAVIDASLKYKTTQYDSIPGIPSSREVFGAVTEIAQSIVATWIEERLSVTSVERKATYYVHYTTTLILFMKASYNYGFTIAEISAAALEGFRTEMRRHTGNQQRSLVSQPFVKKLIEVLKNFEKKNEWQDKVKPRKTPPENIGEST